MKIVTVYGFLVIFSTTVTIDLHILPQGPYIPELLSFILTVIYGL